MCHMSCGMCQVSCVICHVSHIPFFGGFGDKALKLVIGGSVINGAAPSSLGIIVSDEKFI